MEEFSVLQVINQIQNVQDTKYFFLTGINVINLQTFAAFDILRTVHRDIFL